MARHPPPVPKVARTASRAIRRAFRRVDAVVLIGSGADGTWDDHSDVDLVVLVRGRVPRGSRGWTDVLGDAVEDAARRVQVIPLNRKRFAFERRRGSPLVHAARRGRPLGRITPAARRLLARDVPQPTEAWQAEWFLHWLRFLLLDRRRRREEERLHRRFCRGGACRCFPSDIPARVAVNWALVAVARTGAVPGSKAELRRMVDGRLRMSGAAREGLETALEIHHTDRIATRDDQRRTLRATAWLRRWLEARLDVARDVRDAVRQAREFDRRLVRGASGRPPGASTRANVSTSSRAPPSAESGCTRKARSGRRAGRRSSMSSSRPRARRSRPRPGPCPQCGSSRVRVVREAVVLRVRGAAYRFPDVRHEVCSACGERIFGIEASRSFDAVLGARRRSRAA